MCDVYGKNVQVKKMLTNWLNIVLPQWARVKKTFHGNTMSCVENISGVVVSKERHAVSFKRPDKTYYS